MFLVTDPHPHPHATPTCHTHMPHPPIHILMHQHTQSCCQGMKELTDRLQLILVEARELELKMREFREGLRAQVDSILTAPPPRSLVVEQKELERHLEDSLNTKDSTTGTGNIMQAPP